MAERDDRFLRNLLACRTQIGPNLLTADAGAPPSVFYLGLPIEQSPCCVTLCCLRSSIPPHRRTTWPSTYACRANSLETTPPPSSSFLLLFLVPCFVHVRSLSFHSCALPFITYLRHFLIFVFISCHLFFLYLLRVLYSPSLFLVLILFVFRMCFLQLSAFLFCCLFLHCLPRRNSYGRNGFEPEFIYSRSADW